MRKCICVIAVAVFYSVLVLASCHTHGANTSSKAATDPDKTDSAITTDAASETVATAAKTTVSEEESQSATTSDSAAVTTAPGKTDTQTTVSLPKPPARMALADLDYWSRADTLRICHTQSPPFKAVTLKKGTKEYEKILSLLRQAEGGYWGTSQGLAGGFMPVYVYQGITQLDRISISVDSNRNAQFQTDTQQEVSRVEGAVGPYTSIYTMSESLSKEINEFFESLEYTEDLNPGQSASTSAQCVPDKGAS